MHYDFRGPLPLLALVYLAVLLPPPQSKKLAVTYSNRIDHLISIVGGHRLLRFFVCLFSLVKNADIEPGSQMFLWDLSQVV